MSSCLDFEEQVIEGHPHHPMHKTRCGGSNIAPFCPDMEHSGDAMPTFVRRLSIGGEFIVVVPLICVSSDCIAMLQPELAQSCFRKFMSAISAVEMQELKRMTGLEDQCNFDSVLVPVHPAQLGALKMLGGEFRMALSDACLLCRATCSLRTLTVLHPLSMHESRNCIKLPVDVVTTSSPRLISKYAMLNGVTLSPLVKAALQECAQLLRLHAEFESEVASGFLRVLDTNNSASIGYILRHATESYGVVCAYLTERNSSGVFNVVRLFELEGRDSKLCFFREYSSNLISYSHVHIIVTC